MNLYFALSETNAGTSLETYPLGREKRHTTISTSYRDVQAVVAVVVIPRPQIALVQSGLVALARDAAQKYRTVAFKPQMTLQREAHKISRFINPPFGVHCPHIFSLRGNF